MTMDKADTEGGLKADGEASSVSSARAELDLNQFLPYQLNRLADRISQALEKLYADSYQLNIAQWRVLAWLSHCDDLTAKKVCHYTNMDKARVSRAIQALEDRGLISRTPSQQDQRLHNLQLTEAGQALLTELVPEAQSWEADLVSTLSVGEYRDLLNTMRKLERQLERIG
ncbi:MULTISPECIES: MarR family winged helix-turn-helix transcriptional regulator [unclassified Halomonas]|uniref:MarR family winged helix-turn-helix transcriptional regulator n=1 Tax=unclassified Halomonas TaxID=2609666 RepID=UPI00099097DF|nr:MULTISPECIES: MarR family winged helix-turn-helix transcriptional regulator [unclassified Halomonas]AQU84115.1 MarR family transcriptional regulator [Halomonas sp. 'Soap Lake \